MSDSVFKLCSVCNKEHTVEVFRTPRGDTYETCSAVPPGHGFSFDGFAAWMPTAPAKSLDTSYRKNRLSILHVRTIELHPLEDFTILKCETSHECGKDHELHLHGETLKAAGLALCDDRGLRADAWQRANELSDQCGALRTENDELLRENAQLRRQVERLERKAKLR